MGRINPKGYDGQIPTGKTLSKLLPRMMKKVAARYDDRPDAILKMWPEIVGSTLAPQTRAVSFQEGVLLVHVANSTLLSLLACHEKTRILKHLRAKFPKLEIKTILFKMGTFSNSTQM